MSDGTDDDNKGILKKSTDVQRKKSFKWDEMNILETYHPADKTYGHMKVDEPKTPFVFESDDSVAQGALFKAEDLAARLNVASDNLEISRKFQNAEDKAFEKHTQDFNEKRRLHYNEFYACKLAKDHLVHESDDDVAEDDDDDEDDEESKRFAEEAARNARLNASLFRSDKDGGTSSGK